MYLTNDTVTIFNAAYDPAEDFDIYLPTVVEGVSWYYRDIAAIDHSGLRAASTVVVRIPATPETEAKYVDPIAFKALSDKAGHFTLQAGDVIVKGAVTDTGLRPSDITRLYPDVMTVLTVTDNRRAPNARHWRVTGA